MAADDAGERTEQPTPKRRSEARRQGQVPRSTDLTAATSLLVGMLLLNWMGPGIFERLLAMTRDLGDLSDTRLDGLESWLSRCMSGVAGVLLPFLGILLVLSAVAAMTQTGWLISPAKLKPKLDHINPVAGVKRLFSVDALQRLGMGLLKLAIIAPVAWWTITGEIDKVVGSTTLELVGVYHMAVSLMFTLALRLILVLLILGIIDFLYQRWRIEKKLKMTKQEIKDEMKSMDGDPQIRQRRRQMQLRMAMQRLKLDVPKANVVVTNPTEFAVALRYDEHTMAAPRVIAKGVDMLALRIRQLAELHGVPIVQRPPLARALYATVEIGHEIPSQFYRAVAEVLAYVHQLSRKATA